MPEERVIHYRHLRDKDKQIRATVAYQFNDAYDGVEAGEFVTYGLTIVSNKEKIVSRKEGRVRALVRLDAALDLNPIKFKVHAKKDVSSNVVLSFVVRCYEHFHTAYVFGSIRFAFNGCLRWSGFAPVMEFKSALSSFVSFVYFLPIVSRK
jgi:hypothetical protein